AAAAISANTIMDTIGLHMEGCWACAVRCKKVVKTEAPHYVDPTYGGPEYETIASVGSCCGIGDAAVISKASELCNAYGVDTISTGASIAFAMECFEEKIITPEILGGLDLSFGNAGAMVEMVRRIAYREGLGDLLAGGVMRAARRLGAAAGRLAMHIKGLEVPMHEPRLKHGLGLGYAVSPTGADHCHNLHDTLYVKPGKSLEDLGALGVLEPLPAQDLSLDKVRLYSYVSSWRTFANCSVHCQFVPWDLEQTAQLVRGMTGWNASVFELMKVGERAVNLTRCFNLREGFTAADDYLPERFHRAFSAGPLQGVAVDPDALAGARLAFYRMSGWTDQGVPTREKLHELGLGWLAGVMDFIP
ncbi:MAG TPA: aldehyde ferredoxin oxidoreductase, partial [Clostridiales bacterium UBA8153]|nr:aldehyde ferredoxin oxidoreductase [Clostridiales bacterium UBA8153]